MLKTPTQKTFRVLKVLGDLAPVLGMVGLRNRYFGYAGIAIKAIEVLYRASEELRVDTVSAWSYFGLDSAEKEWTQVSPLFHTVCLPKISGRTLRTRSLETGCQCAWEGRMGGARVGWMADSGGKNIANLFVWHSHVKEFAATVCELMWAEIGSRHVTVNQSEGLVIDELDSGHVIPTNLIDELGARVTAFYEKGKTRSYMITGRPGTGKTTCIQHLVRKLALRSVRIPVGELSNGRGVTDVVSHPNDKTLALVPLVATLKPDVIILDDVDRAPSNIQDTLLDFMQLARNHAKLILISVNNPEELSTAFKRPGRIDDHRTVPLLDLGTVKTILGDYHEELVSQVREWPVAYLLEFMERVDVLGFDQAKKEIVELEQRLLESG